MRANRNQLSRRRLLAGACGGGLALTAGCLTSIPSLGQQVQFGPVDDPAPDPPVYRDWVPEVVGDGDNRPTVIYTTPGNLGADTIGVPFTLGWAVVTSSIDYVGVDLQSAEYALTIGGFPTEDRSHDSVTVVRAPVDRSEVHSTIEKTSYEPAGEYEGLELFDRETPDRTVAIGDEVVLGATGDGARSRIERAFDTWQGTEPRLVDTNEEYRAITDRIGASSFLHLGTGPMSPYDQPGQRPRSEWSSMEYRFDEQYAYYVTTLVYSEGEVPSQRSLEETVHDNSRALQSHHVDVRTDGRYAVIAMQASHEVVTDSNDQPAEFIEPHITWGIDDQGETITVIHEAGDSVDASLLTVEVSPHHGSSGAADQQFADRYDVVEPGDTLSVALPDHQEIDRLTITGTVPNTGNRWRILQYSRD